jgi:hypothetical protein
MANITLDLITNKNIIHLEELIEQGGEIVYAKPSKPLPASHGHFNLNDVYKQLTDFANDHNHKNYQIKIEINQHG